MKPTRQRINLSATDTIKFGKYNGITLDDLAINRPEYILGLQESGRYEIDGAILRIAEETAMENDQEGGIEDDPRV